MPRPGSAATRRWRATFITTLVIIAVAGAALAGWWYARESTPVRGPIVLISVDGLRPTRPHVSGSTDNAASVATVDGVMYAAPPTMP